MKSDNIRNIKYRADKNQYTAILPNGNEYSYSDNKYYGYAKLMAEYSYDNDCRIENWFKNNGDGTMTIYASNKENKNKEIIIDTEDYEKICNYHWYLTEDADYNNELYARANAKDENGNKKQIRMHRLILNLPHVYDKDNIVDHINGNGLDNRKNNLRVLTQRKNSKNRTKILSSNTSGINGVRYNPDGPRWTAMWSDKDTGKVKTKSFSEKVYGKEQAKQKAIDYRKLMEETNEYL